MTDPITTTDIDTVTDEVTLSPKQRRELQWRDRKRTVITTLVFCGLCIGYIMFQGKDLAVYQSIVYGCFGLAGSVIGFFIGGQTFHDINSEKINAVQQIRNGPSGPGPRINGPQGGGTPVIGEIQEYKMAHLKDLNSRLKQSQKDGIGKTLLKTSGRFANAGFQAVHNQLLTEIPELSMLTGPLGGLVGDITGMFGKNKLGNARSQMGSIRQSRSRKSGGIEDALNDIAQTNKKIFRTTKKTADNTDSIKKSAYEQMREKSLRKSGILEKKRQSEFAEQVREGQEGNTKYKGGFSNSTSGETSKSPGLEMLKDLLKDPLIEFLGLVMFGPKLIGKLLGGTGKVLKTLFLSPARGISNIAGKKSTKIEEALKASRNSRYDSYEEIIAKAEKDNAPLREKIKNHEINIENVKNSAEGTKFRNSKGHYTTKDEYIKNAEADLSRMRKNYNDSVDYSMNKYGFNEREHFANLDQESSMEKNRSFWNNVRDKFNFKKETPKEPGTGFTMPSEEESAEMLKKTSNFSKTEESGGIMSKLKNLFKLSPEAEGAASKGLFGGILKELSLFIYPVIKGVWDGVNTAVQDPKEWDQLTKTFSDKGPAGIIHEFFQGKGNKIITNMAQGFTKGLWSVTWGFFGDVVDYLVKQIFYLFGDDKDVETYEKLKSIFKDKISKATKGTWLERWVWDPDKTQNLNTAIVQEQRQNNAYSAAKEDQKSNATSQPIAIQQNNNSSPTYAVIGPPAPVGPDPHGIVHRNTAP